MDIKESINDTRKGFEESFATGDFYSKPSYRVYWVSDSPYLHAFDGLDEVHHQMDEDSLLTKMQEIGYKDILRARIPLPNGKAFIRMDFQNGKMG